MRASILWWSAAGGAVIGLLAGLALVTLGALLLPAVVPEATTRTLARHAWWLSALALVAPVVAGAVLGYLEGRLKLS